jgi:hypothetical protein
LHGWESHKHYTIRFTEYASVYCQDLEENKMDKNDWVDDLAGLTLEFEEDLSKAVYVVTMPYLPLEILISIAAYVKRPRFVYRFARCSRYLWSALCTKPRSNMSSTVHLCLITVDPIQP